MLITTDLQVTSSTNLALSNQEPLEETDQRYGKILSETTAASEYRAVQFEIRLDSPRRDDPPDVWRSLDGARDTGLIWGFDSLLLDGKKDQLWTFNRRR